MSENAEPKLREILSGKLRELVGDVKINRLAKACGLSYNTVRIVLYGNENYTIDSFEKVVRATNVDVGDLLGTVPNSSSGSDDPEDEAKEESSLEDEEDVDELEDENDEESEDLEDTKEDSAVEIW